MVGNNFWSEIVIGQEKILVGKKFDLKKFLVGKSFGQKKVLVGKKLTGQEKICWSEKNIWSEKICQKIF